MSKRKSRREILQEFKARKIEAVQAETLNLEEGPPQEKPEEVSQPPVPVQTPPPPKKVVTVNAKKGPSPVDVLKKKLICPTKHNLFQFVWMVIGFLDEQEITKYWNQREDTDIVLLAARSGGGGGGGGGIVPNVGERDAASSSHEALAERGREELLALMNQRALTAADVRAWELLYKNSMRLGGGAPLDLYGVTDISISTAITFVYLSPAMHASVNKSFAQVRERRTDLTLHDLMTHEALSAFFAEIVANNITLSQSKRRRGETVSMRTSVRDEVGALLYAIKNVDFYSPSSSSSSSVSYLPFECLNDLYK